MPIYKRQARSGQTVLNWQGYKFHSEEEVVTLVFLDAHPELTLISEEPFPEAMLLHSQQIDFSDPAGGSLIITIPPCQHYILSLGVMEGILELTEEKTTGGATLLLLEGMRYVSAIPVVRAQIPQVKVSATAPARGLIVIERA